MPLPFSPIPLTAANFGVLFIALTLGSRRAATAMLLYLAEGAMGLPVFSPAGPGGVSQLLGPTGGYLMAYPVVAFVAGWISERGQRSALRFTLAAVAGQVLLFVSGVTWLVVAWHAPLGPSNKLGCLPVCARGNYQGNVCRRRFTPATSFVQACQPVCVNRV